MALVKVLMGSINFIPVYTDLFAILALSIGACSAVWIVANALGVKSLKTKIFMAALIVSNPINCEWMIFGTYNIEIGLSYGLCAWSASLLSVGSISDVKKRYKFIILGIASSCFSVSIYQSNLILILTLSGIILILKDDVRENGARLNAIALSFSLILISTVLYYLINYIVLMSFSKSAYIENSFMWNFGGIDGAMHRWQLGLNKLFNPSSEGFLGLSLPLSLLLLCLLPIFKTGSRPLMYLYSFLLFILSLSLSALIGGMQPLRTLQSLIVFLSAAALITDSIARRNFVNTTNSLFLLAVLILSIMSAQRIMWTDTQRFIIDKNCAIAIGTYMNRSDIAGMNIIIIGHPRDSNDSKWHHGEVVGHSIFSWDGGNPYRIKEFLSIYGFDYKIPSPDLIKISENTTSENAITEIISNDLVSYRFGNTIVIKFI
jgi:hypothetical protein